MPTSYTAVLYERDQHWTEYLARCARGMGALRDELMDAPLPERIEVDAEYTDRVRSKEIRLAHIAGCSDATLLEERAERVAQLGREIDRAVARRQRYQRMRGQIDAWTPPTPDHEQLRKFAISQLALSEIDASEATILTLREACKLMASKSVDALRTKELSDAHEELANAHQALAHATRRMGEANAWLQALRMSLHGKDPF